MRDRRRWWSVRAWLLVPMLVLTGSVYAIATFARKTRTIGDVRVPTNPMADEIAVRGFRISKEALRLGPDHLWAGAYMAGELGDRLKLMLAPSEGCLATRFGCTGTYAVNFGRISSDGDRLHMDFALPNEVGVAHFDTDYVIEGRGADRTLRPVGGGDVLRPVVK